MRKIVAILPFALILLFIILFYLIEGVHFFNFDDLQKEHLRLQAYVHDHPILSAIYFMGVYTLSVILILPDSTLLTLLAGFLFPLPLGVIYVSISETIGATLFFLAIRLGFKEIIDNKRKPWIEHMRLKAKNNQVSYLLFLRLSHLLPFWVVNIGAAIFRIKIWRFIWTTWVGTLPFIFFLVYAGEDLSKYFETHTHFDLSKVFTTKLKLTLIALGCFALLPILYKKFKGKKY